MELLMESSVLWCVQGKGKHSMYNICMLRTWSFHSFTDERRVKSYGWPDKGAPNMVLWSLKKKRYVFQGKFFVKQQ